jgi:hypothetical protein
MRSKQKCLYDVSTETSREETTQENEECNIKADFTEKHFECEVIFIDLE